MLECQLRDLRFDIGWRVHDEPFDSDYYFVQLQLVVARDRCARIIIQLARCTIKLDVDQSDATGGSRCE